MRRQPPPVARQARNYVFTINFGDGEVTVLLPEEWPIWLTFCTWQLEIGAEGTLHYQGYMELLGKHSIVQLHEVDDFRHAHFEVRRGTQAQAIAYTRKDETRVDGPWTHGVLKEQGKRSDLLEVKEALDAGVALKRVHEDHFSTFIRFGRALKEYKRTITEPRNFKSKVILFVGPPGVGKSTVAKILAKKIGSVYRVPAPKGSGLYYDDYDGQDVMLVDEFDGHVMKPTDFNALCDEHECVLPVHGGAGHQMISPYIFIVSNYTPKTWWKKRNASQLRQTTRRIDVVFKMGMRSAPQAPGPVLCDGTGPSILNRVGLQLKRFWVPADFGG